MRSLLRYSLVAVALAGACAVPLSAAPAESSTTPTTTVTAARELVASSLPSTTPIMEPILLTALKSLYPGTWSTRLVQYFPYSFTWWPINASVAQSPQQVTINSDSDFILTGISSIASNQSNSLVPATNVPLEMLMIDSSGQQYSSGYVQVMNFAGSITAGPNILPWPRRIPAQTTVTINLTNDDTTTNWYAKIMLHGVRVFGPGSAAVDRKEAATAHALAQAGAATVAAALQSAANAVGAQG